MVLALYGAGGMGRSILDAILEVNQQKKQWDDILFIDDVIKDETISGIKKYSFSDFQKTFKPNDDVEVFITVGEPKKRELLYNKVKKLNYNFARVIHPNAHISQYAVIGSGVLIASCSIYSNSFIDDNVLLLDSSIIGHDCIIKSHSVISPFVFIGGHTTVSECVFVGAHTSIKDRLHIGSNSVIAISSAVFKDVPDNHAAFGNPARSICRKDDSFIW